MILKKRFTFILLLLAFACTEEQIIQVGVKGTLTGVTRSYSDFYATGPLGGVRVTLEGTDPEVSVLTNSEGKFTISDLVTGTYNLVFEKPGYGTHKILGYAFVGGQEAAITYAGLYLLPELKIKDLEVSIAREFNAIMLRGNIFVDLPEENTNQYGYLRYYLSDKPDVSPLSYLESKVFSYFTNKSVYSLSIQVNPSKFAPGTKLYLNIYPCADQSSGYLDLDTGNTIYSSVALVGSEVVSADVPQ